MGRVRLPVHVLWISRYDYDKGWVLLPHMHDHYQIIYVKSGSARMTLGNAEWAIKERSLVLLKPGTVHGIVGDGGKGLKTLDTKFSLDDKALARELERVPVPLFDSPMIAEGLLEKMREAGDRKPRHFREFCALYLLELLYTLAASEAALEKPLETMVNIGDPLIAKVLAFVEAHYVEKINLTIIAEKLGYSIPYLSRRLRASEFGSFSLILQDRRVTKAKELLRYSDYSIKKIATLCGYKSVQHFSRVFAERELSPPAAWRTRERNGVRKDINVDEKFQNVDLTVKR